MHVVYPGSVGGAVFMNAGAYNGEIKGVIKEAQVMDNDGNIYTISKEDLELGYRTSKVMKEGLIVIGATFTLEKGDSIKIKDRIDELTKRERKSNHLSILQQEVHLKDQKGILLESLFKIQD